MAMTTTEVLALLPTKIGRALDPNTVHEISLMMADPNMQEAYRENLISYTTILTTGKYKLSSYVDAVKYVSHKLRNLTDKDAYIAAFPDKYQDFINRGVSSKDIASYISAYSKNKLVAKILEQSLVPSWLINQDLYQRALNTQAALMLDEDVSPKVRSDAANSILTHLKMPEVSKFQIDVGVKKDSIIDALRASTAELVNQQRAMIAAGGMSARDAAENGLVIEGEVVEDDK